MLLSINALILNVFVLFQYSGTNIIAKKFDPYNMDPGYRVPKISTPLSEKEIAESLCSSHIELHGEAPSRNRLALSWAQISLENARGKKVWNNNLGNQGPFRMDQKYYHHLRYGWPYRSFEKPKESAKSYWQILGKCSMALRAFDDGNPAMAAVSLKNCNYYSNDMVDQYAKNLSSLYYEAIKKVIPGVNCGNNR